MDCRVKPGNDHPKSFLDFIPIVDYIPVTSLDRGGVFRRRSRRRSEGRRLRAGLVTPSPGGPGTRPGGTTAAPQGACWTGTGRQRPRPRKRGPGDRNRRTGAPRGDVPPPGRARRKAWLETGASRRPGPLTFSGVDSPGPPERGGRRQRPNLGRIRAARTMELACCTTTVRPRASGDPGQNIRALRFHRWIPACAGMNGVGYSSGSVVKYNG